ncbi:MAG: hypothetical protein COV52_02365 [Gammaproteobacteria bacterium CG11_big_fil_rev_8_21_14_0_20_46_22]|nr:MAG: hypothetical protein COW05_08405 [Gammaproteobacteria bacterium CG12_big_fil_rev_8_21_14_0_65_46_12]PIR11624.1 MAG: hypothetical protein COV52_02365 [Gammaproteobacteria bacterium CG11_big_fil_rev_8_21_14_0_20_46_22]
MKGGENIDVKNDISFNIQVVRSVGAKDLKSLECITRAGSTSAPGTIFTFKSVGYERRSVSSFFFILCFKYRLRGFCGSRCGGFLIPHF